jgi:RNA polymerase sigma factor (sigma-70 family)
MEASISAATGLDELSEPLRSLRSRFETLVEPHRPELWEFARRLTGSIWDAEDLVQDTLTRAFANLAHLWQAVNPRAYLFRIATNLWIDQLRREGRAELVDLPEADLVSAEATDAAIETREAMLRLVSVLPPRQRVVLLLCDTLGFRAGEAAAMLGTTEGGIKAALHRARAALERSRAEDRRPTALLRAEPPTELVRRYVAAFNARDPDAIAALLTDDAVTTIVGSAQELGREVTRASSLAEWAVDPTPQSARAGVLEGREVVFVFYGSVEEASLAWLIEFDEDAGSIPGQRLYYYCPELIRAAAAALGVPAVTHGYQWVA